MVFEEEREKLLGVGRGDAVSAWRVGGRALVGVVGTFLLPSRRLTLPAVATRAIDGSSLRRAPAFVSSSSLKYESGRVGVVRSYIGVVGAGGTAQQAEVTWPSCSYMNTTKICRME